jgi:hypothetical protein
MTRLAWKRLEKPGINRKSRAWLSCNVQGNYCVGNGYENIVFLCFHGWNISLVVGPSPMNPDLFSIGHFG